MKIFATIVFVGIMLCVLLELICMWWGNWDMPNWASTIWVLCALIFCFLWFVNKPWED